MIKLDLVSKKRKPIKKYAFLGIAGALLILVLITVFHEQLSNTVKIALLILVALLLIVNIWIINYSLNFRNVIGSLSFFQDRIEIEFLQKKEILPKDQITAIRFRLKGYEGRNDSTVIENLVWFPSYFWYHSGLNNFIHIHTITGVRIFEVYIPNRRIWIELKKLATNYKR